jgi:hypothetical protein
MNENALNYYGTWNIFTMSKPSSPGYYMITQEGEPRTAYPAFWTGDSWRLFKLDIPRFVPIVGVIAWSVYPEPFDL